MPLTSNSRRGISLREPAGIALETLRTHKLRSFLTLLGIILSVSTLIVVVAMIEGTNRYVADHVANFGANVFLVRRFPIVTSREQFAKLERRNKNVTWEDFEYLRDNMRLAKAVGLEVRRLGRLAIAENDELSHVSQLRHERLDQLGKLIVEEKHR